MPGTAHGRLSFERAGVTTVLRDAYAESPLRLLTPRNHGEAAWVYTSTLGGGFVDGDRVRLRISVGGGARAFVSTQGATRIYRSPRGCENETLAEVAAGAALRAQVDAVPVRARARLLESGSALGTDALVVRFAATSVEELVGTLRDRLAAIPALLGDDPWRAARERMTHAPHAA